MDVNSVFGGDSLKAADLQGQEVPVVPASVENEEVRQRQQVGPPTFQGKQKCLICNKTGMPSASRLSTARIRTLGSTRHDHPRYRFCRVPG